MDKGRVLKIHTPIQLQRWVGDAFIPTDQSFTSLFKRNLRVLVNRDLLICTEV